jgi:hypothetical protein
MLHIQQELQTSFQTYDRHQKSVHPIAEDRVILSCIENFKKRSYYMETSSNISVWK